MLMEKIDVVLNLVDSKDHELYEHLERTAMFAFALAKKLELSSKDMETAYLSGLLHDIGKVSAKNDNLNEATRKALESAHPLVGSLMLQLTPELRDVALIISHHHERFNGSGNPDHLIGTEIPLLARILTIADAYDKMRAKGTDFIGACEELRVNSGTQFDPALVEPFIQVLQEEDLA